MSYIGPISIAAGSRIVGPSGGGGNPAGPNCVLLLHCDGTNGSTSFPDNSGQGHVVTSHGTPLASVTTSNKEFGTGAADLSAGSTAFLSVDGGSDFAFGNGDFTIDFWLYTAGTGVGAGLVYMPEATLYIDGAGVITWPGMATTGTVILNAWQHIALTISGGTARLFQNGVLKGSQTGTSYNIAGAANSPQFGTYAAGGSYTLIGQMDEIRVLKGRAAWTANFTPPTSPYT